MNAVRLLEYGGQFDPRGVAASEDEPRCGRLAQEGIAYVPFFPLGGGPTQLQSSTLSDVAQRLHATLVQIALLRRAPHILLIAGTSSVTHLRENVTAATLRLSDDDFPALNELTRQRA
jgi:pyridoxine 4-dehydrogenase